MDSIPIWYPRSIPLSDDYITIGSATSNECAINKEIMTVTCGLLGTPLAQEKCEGPSSILTFLGIEIDTTNMQLRLPRKKIRQALSADYGMEYQEIVHKERATAACMCSSKSW